MRRVAILFEPHRITRGLATAEDVAGVALFLAPPAADYLTGITIPVAGGSWITTQPDRVSAPGGTRAAPPGLR